MNTKIRILTFLVAMMMVISLCSVFAFAEEIEGNANTETTAHVDSNQDGACDECGTWHFESDITSGVNFYTQQGGHQTSLLINETYSPTSKRGVVGYLVSDPEDSSNHILKVVVNNNAKVATSSSTLGGKPSILLNKGSAAEGGKIHVVELDFNWASSAVEKWRNPFSFGAFDANGNFLHDIVIPEGGKDSEYTVSMINMSGAFKEGALIENVCQVGIGGGQSESAHGSFNLLNTNTWYRLRYVWDQTTGAVNIAASEDNGKTWYKVCSEQFRYANDTAGISVGLIFDKYYNHGGTVYFDDISYNVVAEMPEMPKDNGIHSISNGICTSCGHVEYVPDNLWTFETDKLTSNNLINIYNVTMSNSTTYDERDYIDNSTAATYSKAAFLSIAENPSDATDKVLKINVASVGSAKLSTLTVAPGVVDEGDVYVVEFDTMCDVFADNNRPAIEFWFGDGVSNKNVTALYTKATNKVLTGYRLGNAADTAANTHAPGTWARTRLVYDKSAGKYYTYFSTDGGTSWVYASTGSCSLSSVTEMGIRLNVYNCNGTLYVDDLRSFRDDYVTMKLSDGTTKCFGGHEYRYGECLNCKGEDPNYDSYVAHINGLGYASLQAAFDAVQSGETITLLKDLTVETAATGTHALSYTGGASFTLDLDGKTLSSDLGGSTLRFNIGSGSGISNTNVVVTIKNGTIISGENTANVITTARSSGNTLVMNLQDLTVKNGKGGNYAIQAGTGVTINANKVNVNSEHGGSFYANGGTIVLDDCSVNVLGAGASNGSVALCIANKGKITVNSGSYKTAPVEGSEEMGLWVANIKSTGGTLVINGGTFEGTVAGEVTSGYANGLIYATTGGVVEINDGTFISNAAIFDTDTNASVSLAGGTYSANPVTDGITLADGYVVGEKDGKHIVHVHSYSSVVTAPTCEAEGYTTHTCSVCDDSYVDTKVAANGHTAGAAADCENAQTCTVCGAEIAKALGHTKVVDAAKAATCTETGLTEGKHCSVCNKVLVEQTVVPVIAHSYNSVVTAPTCEAEGYTTHTCSACGHSYVDTKVAAKGHTAGAAADCENAQTCTVCGAELAKALGHTEVVDAAKAATCTETGLTEGKHCSVCNKVLVAQTTVNALGHTAGAAADCENAQTCTVCGAELAPAKGHNFVEGKCACGAEDPNYVPPHTHSYTEVVTDPTCVAEGYTTYTCSCGHSFVGNKVQATGNHDYVEGGKCTVCGDQITSGYMLYIYNGDGSIAMVINGSKSISDFSLKSAIEDARVFANNGFLFGITGTPTLRVEFYEDSTEDESFVLGSDVTVYGNGHVIQATADITISGSAKLVDTGINANGANALTVSGLTFEGNSWINSGSAEALTVSGVKANATPKNTSYTNSRGAFISLGRNEGQTLALTVENSNIVVPSGTNPILGWAQITEANIVGNTFGSASVYQNSGDSVKFMSIADGAVLNFVNNTLYSNYNGIVIGQNTTRANSYTATFDGNEFHGEADHVWIEVSGSNVCNGSINLKSDNTINGNAVNASAIKLHPNLNTFTGYMGTDVVLNNEGKVIGGEILHITEGLIADGYELGEDGKITEAAKAFVAEVNGVGYETLAEAAAVAQAGDEIILLADAYIAEGTDVTIPGGVILNGNGFSIFASGADNNTSTSYGYVVAGGNLTIKGITKVEKFSASYYNHIITIGEGASLQVFGKNRVSVGYGSGFDVTGTITDAKTADKTQVVPSLVINAGVSIVGSNDTYMNVNNAYVVIGSSSSKNSNAAGKFDLTFNNCIVEFTSQFTFAQPKNNLNPVFNVTFADSVVTSATKFCFMAPGSNVVVDNSSVVLGSYLHNSGTLTVQNGSTFVGSMIQYGENGGNSGTIIVDNASLTIKNNNPAYAMDGNNTGKLIVKNGATANVDYIIETGIELGVNSSVSTKSEALDVTTASGYEVKYEEGKYVVVEAAKVYVAEVNGVGYETLADALAAAKTMTGNVTVEILDKVTLSGPINGSFDSITFVGKDSDAEIYIDLQGYIEAAGEKLYFADLTLSKVAGGYIANAGFMNLAFGIYNTDVTYTNCVFANGAYASGGNATFIDCTFYRSHDRYGMWVYGDVDALVDGCTFADIRGIKLYSEGMLTVGDLTVKNTDFSAVDNKPAIVLTSGNSVTLEGNTYNATKGVFELDLDGVPNGTLVTSDVPPTCVNDNGACGVIVDGKIYTTVAQAAEVATSGSTVTLLHNSLETVELAEGVTLDKNGFDAAGVTVAVAVKVAEVNGVQYATLAEAFAAVSSDSDTVIILADVTENLTGAYLRGNITTLDGANVTITLTNADWVYCPYSFVLGESITLNVPALFYYAGGAIIRGTVVTEAYYQRYRGTKLYVEGTMTVTSETFILRYTDDDANAGIYVNGGTLNASVIYFYQGTISGTNGATINAGVYWQTNETDGQGSANLVLDNATLNVTVNEQIMKATGNSTVTLTGGSTVVVAGGYQGETPKIDATSSFVDGNGNDIFETAVAEVNGVGYATLAEAFAAAQAGETITLLADLEIVGETFTIPAGKSLTLDMNGKKITATDNKAANVCYELFYIYGELTVIGNGTIELTSTSNDTSWAKSSTIFHNRGGVLTIENGTFKHLGGTCMAFVIDNNANSFGDAVTTIKDGTFDSAYIAIRNRMEYEGGNGGGNGIATLNVEGGTIAGVSRAIWAQASSSSVTAPACGAIKVSGGNIGLIDTARSAGALSMTTITGGTVASFKGEVGELVVNGGTLGEATILTAAGQAVDYAIDANGAYVAAVAKVGTTNYADLQQAIIAAAPNGTVELLSNVTVEKWIMFSEILTIGDGTVITLDLDGLTIDGNGFTLTVNDVESANNGDHLFYDGDYNIYDLTIVMADNVNGFGITSGTIKNVTFLGGCSASGSAAIHVSDGIITGVHAGNVTIDGCTFKNNGGAIYSETAQNGLVVNNSTFEISASANVILLCGTEKFTNNTVVSGRTVNVVSGSPVVSGNDFGNVRLKVYNEASATITDNKINNLVFNEVAPMASAFADNTLSESAQAALDAVSIVYGAEIGGVKYETFEEALAAAADGDVIKLCDDVTVNGLVYITKNVTIDINGMTFTSEGIVSFAEGGTLVDNGTTKGLIVVPRGYIMSKQAAENSMLPVWNEEGTGYILVAVKAQSKPVKEIDEDSFSVEFRPSVSGGGVTTSEIFENGALNNGLNFSININFIKNGNVAQSLTVKISDELISRVYTNGTSVRFTVNGASVAYDSYDLVLVISSDTGIAYSGVVGTFVPKKSDEE